MQDNSVVLGPGELGRHHIYIMNVCYPLTEAEFMRLVKSPNKWKEWSKEMLILAAGLALKIIIVCAMAICEVVRQNIKNYEKLIDKIEAWECIAVGICIILAAVFYIIPKFYVTEDDKLVEKVRNFYKKEEQSNGQNK